MKKLLLKSLSVFVAVALVTPVQLFAGYKNLKEAVSDSTEYKTYSLTKNEVVTESLGYLAGTQLIVYGKGKNIIAKNESYGFYIDDDNQTLIINDVNKISDFNNHGSDGGAICNNSSDSIVTIGNNITFTSNISNDGGAIYNGGILIIDDNVAFTKNIVESDGGAIENYGGTVIVGDNAIFSSNSSHGYGGAIDNYVVGVLTIGDNAKFTNNKSIAYGGAIDNNDDSYMLIGDKAEFSSNSAGNNGGAIYNYDALIEIGNKATFSSNIAGAKGGAIYNDKNGKTVIGDNATFSSNYVIDETEGYGGAIYNYSLADEIIIGNNATFDSNKSYYGGAISNHSTLTIGDNATFSSNIAGAKGGAISNCGILTIGDNATFKSNDLEQTGTGGAIYNDEAGKIIIGDNATFSSNNLTKVGGAGGAIFNNNNADIVIGKNASFKSNSSKTMGAIVNGVGSTLKIGDNATFSSNSTELDGGAIINYGVLTIENGAIFTNNTSAENSGGAIFNYAGTLNLIAKTKNIEFTGNKAGEVSNAIQDAEGTINLWAGSADIIFNDRIKTSQYSTPGVLNINESNTENYPTIGKIILNENMREYTGTVNLYAGTLKLGESSYSGFFRGNLNVTQGAVLDATNNKIDELRTQQYSGDALFEIDANLVGYNTMSNDQIGFADNYTSTGTITLSNVNILSKTSNTGSFYLVSNGDEIPTLNVDLKVNNGGEVVKFSKENNRKVNYETLGGSQTLNQLVADTETEYKVYNLKNDENIILDLGTLKGTQLIINGNGKNIITQNEVSGINVTSGQTLRIENVDTIGGFNYNNKTLAGAIYNKEGTVKIGDNTTFDSCVGISAGSIVNEDGMVIIGNNVKFSSNIGLSGAINSVGNNISILSIGNNVTFDSNKALAGAAIISDKNSIVTIGDNATFISNGSIDESATTLKGGAIVNTNGSEMTIGNNAKFSFSIAKDEGGAIYNDENGEITIGDNATFNLNKSNGWAGSIYNEDSTTTIGDNVIFDSNNAGLAGGAICNKVSGTITIGNNAIFNSNSVTDGMGGAIVNTGDSEMVIGKNAIFSSNSSGEGGAIYNDDGGNITIQDGAKFINNNADIAVGGAIYNHYGTLNLIADKNNIEFTGNKANGVSNAIFDNKGTINLWAFSADIIFNDRIRSDDSSSVLDINRPSSLETRKVNGKVILNEDMSGYTGTVRLHEGTLELGKKGTLFGGTMEIDNATISLANSIVQNYNFKILSIEKTLTLKVDADLKAEKMDTITADTYTSGKKINVTAINILKDTSKKDEISLEFIKSEEMKQDVKTITRAYSDMWEYNVSYDATTGNMNFLQGNMVKVNPMVQESAVASVSGLLGQVAVANQSFDNITNKAGNNENEASNASNLYVSANTNQVFEQTGKIERGLWLRPYVVSDTLDLDAISDVDSTMYGTLAGYDMPIGSDKMLSFYIGYTGGNQKYEEIKINQTAYVLGVTGMLIKDNWYIGATINAGMNKLTADNDFGSDDIDKTTYSIGFKGGYDFDLGKNWILQPNMILMYTGITAGDYTNVQGNKIEDNGLSSILVQPQLKASWKLSNGWTPYGLVDVAINTGELETKVNGAKLEDNMKLDPYFEYGLGVNKAFVNTPWSCYGQVTGKSGSRSGVGFNCGIKYAF